MLCAGVTVIGEVNAWTSNVMNLIWLIGTFTFAVVLAVVTEDIVATVLVSQSRFPLVVADALQSDIFLGSWHVLWVASTAAKQPLPSTFAALIKP